MPPGPGVLPEGAARVAFAEITDQAQREAEIDAAATVIVCITCRRPADPEDFPRPGLAFAAAVAEAAQDTGVRVPASSLRSPNFSGTVSRCRILSWQKPQRFALRDTGK